MNNHLTLALRWLAALTAACFSWSFIFATAAQAATYKAPQAPGHHRLLSDKEMARIVGSSPTPIGSDPVTGGGAGGNAASSPGAAFPWEGSMGGVKTGTGNKLTSIPIIGWTARGGLGVDLTLYHNSLSGFTSGDSRGSKWTYSYDTAMVIGNTGNVKIAWGNGTIYVFTRNVDGSYTPPPGVHDRLVANGSSPISSFDLTTKSQIKFHLPYNTTVANYLLTTISDENGNTITVNRAANGGISSVTDPTNRTITFGASGGYVSSATDTAGHQWLFNYDGNGNLSQVVYPLINGTYYSVTLGYDGNHNITSFKDKNGNTSTASFNSDSTTAWEQDPSGNRGSFAYYPGSTSGSGYTTITDPNGHVTTHTYSGGVLASVTDALNNNEYYSYDGANNVTQKQDQRGYYWNYSYDGMGNVLTAKDPYTNTTTFTYNGHNRLLTAAAPLGRSAAITYDSSDNATLVQEKDPSGNVLATTTLVIGSYGLPYSKTDANNHKTLYGYDSNGYLNGSVTPAGRQYLWYYDALGFLTGRTDPLNRTTTYTADAWERNVQTTYPDNTTATFGYDANGNLTNFNNYTANWSRTYDADNRETAEYCSGTQAIRYAYDASGQKGLKSSFTDSSGRTVAYSYSVRNELATVTDPGGQASYQYDPNGNQTAVFTPNGRYQDAYFNNDNTIGTTYSVVTSGNAIFETHNYSYNADDQLTQAREGTSTNPANNTTVTNYGYDGQGHLSSAQRTGDSAYNRLYTCDGVGNRTLQGGDNLSGPMTYDADDELTGFSWNNGSTAGAATFGYDANGQRTSETTGITAGSAGYATQFGYDFDGNLTSIVKSGNTTTFRYDPLGRQVSRTVNGTTTGYGFDGGQLILEEINGSVTATYTWGNGLIRRNGEFPLTDYRGNVRHMTDGNGTYTGTTQADPFGLTVAQSGSSANPYLSNASSGYRSDGDGPADAAPLQKVGARYYDPQFGVFLTRDTDLGQRPYAYCDGDPINFNDPSGHEKLVDLLRKSGILGVCSTPMPFR